MKKTIIAIIVLILVLVGVYFVTKSLSPKGDTATNTPATPNTTVVPSTEEGAKAAEEIVSVIGKSVEGRDITAYTYLPMPAAGGQAGDTGAKELLFIGGIHGGYEWNTVLVAYQTMDYLKATPNIIPANVKVTVIPVLNPDGLYKTLGTTTRFSAMDVPQSLDKQIAGRFNTHTVDLNRNFDCGWQASGTWQNKKVSGGSKAFSEPESQAIKKYAETNTPVAVAVWFSAAGGVYASNCENGVSAETETLTKLFADASLYPAFQSFDFYETTGDMVNWFAKQNIPAISVLLTNHTDTEWTKNQKGIAALLTYYAQK